MPRKLCINSGCAAPPTYRGYCPSHARAKERRTNRAGKSIYNSAKWRHTRKAQLFREPLCPCGDIATDVHHRIDLADGGDPWNADNLQSLCHSCHSRLTAGKGRVAT